MILVEFYFFLNFYNAVIILYFFLIYYYLFSIPFTPHLKYNPSSANAVVTGKSKTLITANTLGIGAILLLHPSSLILKQWLKW